MKQILLAVGLALVVVAVLIDQDKTVEAYHDKTTMQE